MNRCILTCLTLAGVGLWLLQGLALAASPDVSSHSVSAPASATSLAPTAPRIDLATAIGMTLEKNPNIRVQRSYVDYYRGTYLQAVGAFDYDVKSKAERDKSRTPAFASVNGTNSLYNTFADNLTYQLSVAKKLRNGILITPQASVSRALNEAPNEVPSVSSVIAFTVTIPLLQGLGIQVATASERGNRVLMQAYDCAYRHTLSLEIMNTVAYYWQCWGAEQNVRINRETEERAAQLVTLTRKLVTGYLKPAAQVQQAIANRDQATANRLAAEKKFIQAMQQLAQEMGLDETSIVNAPITLESSPELPDIPGISTEQTHLLIAAALVNRLDLQSLRRQSEAYGILADGSRNQMLPALNLNLGGGFNGVAEDTDAPAYGRALGDNLQGLVSGSLSLDWSIQNNTARGAFIATRSQRDRYQAAADQLLIQIASGVMTDVSSLERTVAEWRKRRDAARYYLQAVNDQEKMFKLGMATLVDMLSTQDSLAQAQVNEISARVSGLIALVQLRFDMGQLWRPSTSNNLCSMDVADLLKVPPAAGAHPASGD